MMTTRSGSHPFQVGNQLRRFRGVPDIDADADDLRVVGKDALGDINGALLDVELQNLGARLQIAQIGHQVAETERAVRVLRVQRGQDDVGHGDNALSHTRRMEQC